VTSIVSGVTDFLLTWAVHATVLSAGALALGRWVIRDPRVRDCVWKVALIAPVISATAAMTVTGPLEGLRLGVVHVPSVLRDAVPSLVPPVTATVQVSAQGTASSVSTQVVEPLAKVIRYAVGLGLLLPGMFTVGRLMSRRRRFSASLRTRHPTSAEILGVSDATVRSLTALPLRLSVCESVGSAAALGRREVCVAPSTFSTLAEAGRRSVIAHEIAHLERRDPVWMGAAQALASMLVVTPLVAMVANRLRHDAEFICDEVAVSQVEDPIAYVRALTSFARALDPASGYAATFASGRSRIVQRAERVLGADAIRQRVGTGRLVTGFVWAVAIVLCLVLPHLSASPRPVTTRSEVREELRAMPTSPARVFSVSVKARQRDGDRKREAR
jgi:beta-lactamase regulating signal transducer with metallopeptidase domain